MGLEGSTSEAGGLLAALASLEVGASRFGRDMSLEMSGTLSNNPSTVSLISLNKCHSLLRWTRTSPNRIKVDVARVEMTTVTSGDEDRIDLYSVVEKAPSASSAITL